MVPTPDGAGHGSTPGSPAGRRRWSGGFEAEPLGQPSCVEARPRWGLAVVCTVLFLTFLDNTVVSVVLVGVQSDLHVGVAPLQWVVDGYMLAFAGLMLTGGALGDLFGRKKVMLGGVLVFTGGSAIALVALTPGMLIAGRVIMGIGAAASEPGTLSMIRHLYRNRAGRDRALGIWAAVSGAALALGPIVGGAIEGVSSWRYVFALNVVLGVAVVLWGTAVLPENADPQGRKLDLVGMGLGVVAISAGTFAIIGGESSGYLTWWIDLLFALSVASGACFVHWERRVEDPVLELTFFKDLRFTGSNLVAFTTNFAVFAIFFFTTFYLELVSGFSAYAIAVAFLAMAGAMVFVAPLAGRWVARRGPRAPLVTGCLLAGAGMFVVQAQLAPSTSQGAVEGSLALVGLGFGMTLAAMTSAVLSIVPAERSGMAASTVNTFRELGGVFGVALLGAIVNGQLTSELAGRLRALGIPASFRSVVIEGVTHGGTAKVPGAQSKLVKEVLDAAYSAFGNGLHLALDLAGALLLVSAVAAFFLVRRRGMPADRAAGAVASAPSAPGAQGQVPALSPRERVGHAARR